MIKGDGLDIYFSVHFPTFNQKPVPASSLGNIEMFSGKRRQSLTKAVDKAF